MAELKNTKKPVTARSVAARSLPHNSDAEQSVLGCALIDRNAADFVLSELKAADFYFDANKHIFEAMYNIAQASVPVDIVTVSEEVARLNLMDTVGGMTYIASLSTAVPSAAHHRHYCDIVKKNSMLRELIGASQNIIDAAFDVSSLDNGDVLSYAEKQIFDIGESSEKSSLSQINPVLDRVIDRLDKIHRDKSILRGIPTGFRDLDKLTNGLQNSDLILLAARPSVGKTSLGMNLIQNIALASGPKTETGESRRYKCAVFSLEMSSEQLAQRMLCSVAGVNMKNAVSGELSKEDWMQVWNAKRRLAEADIFIDDSSLVTPVEILSKCRRLKRERGLDVVMIDYLQLMSSGAKSDNRQGEVADITRRLKIAAKELNVPIILLSQMSRDVEKRPGHKPQLSDLRESGAIEQDADIVMFIHRKYDRDDESVPPDQRNLLDLIVAKHRNGEVKTLQLYWHGESVTFRNVQT